MICWALVRRNFDDAGKHDKFFTDVVPVISSVRLNNEEGTTLAIHAGTLVGVAAPGESARKIYDQNEHVECVDRLSFEASRSGSRGNA